MFKVMTWNVENLFKPTDPDAPSQAVYDTKIQGLASVINGQAPDALALQEIGDPDALDDLIAKLSGAWNKRVSDHPDGRQIRVAWITRSAIDESSDIVQFPAEMKPVQTEDDGTPLNEMGRGGVAITVRTDSGKTVRLLTCHLKSKLLTFPQKRFTPHDEDERARYAAYALHRRAAESATMRVAVSTALQNAGQDRPLVLTGDLNDTEQAATSQLLLGPPGSEIGTVGFDRPDKGDAQRLWNLAPLMPADANYSRIDQGRKELIDHILVSAALVKPVASIEVKTIIQQPLPSITPDPNERKDAPSSDHAPVVATFANL